MFVVIQPTIGKKGWIGRPSFLSRGVTQWGSTIERTLDLGEGSARQASRLPVPQRQLRRMLPRGFLQSLYRLASLRVAQGDAVVGRVNDGEPTVRRQADGTLLVDVERAQQLAAANVPAPDHVVRIAGDGVLAVRREGEEGRGRPLGTVLVRLAVLEAAHDLLLANVPQDKEIAAPVPVAVSPIEQQEPAVRRPGRDLGVPQLPVRLLVGAEGG